MGIPLLKKKSLLKNKKNIFIIFGSVLFSLLIWYLYPFIAFDSGDKIESIFSQYKQVKEYSITGEYNERFIIKEKLVTNFPHPIFDFEIYSQTQNDKYLVVKLEGMESLGAIEGLYNSSNLRCYMVSNTILYKRGIEGTYKSVNLFQLKERYQDYHFLIPIVRQILKNNWNWIYGTSDFLLLSNDLETIEILKRYARGNFTQEEIKHNKTSRYSIQDIQRISRQLIDKYRL